MRSLPLELLLLIFGYLDYRSLSRAMRVCRTWASVSRDVICARGQPSRWLSVALNRPYAPWLRHLILRTSAESRSDWVFANVQHVSIALQLLDDRLVWSTIDMLARCGYPNALSLTIFDMDSRADGDAPPSAVHPLQLKRLPTTAFLLLSCRERLSRLCVDAVLMPEPLQWDGCSISVAPKTAFRGLRALKTHVTVEAAWSTLSVLPALSELTLDIVSPDAAGAVVAAVAALQPRLRVLELIFRRRFVLNGERDLAALGAISLLEALDIRDKGPGGRPWSSVDAQHWRAFIKSLPHLAVLRLPQLIEVPFMADGMRFLANNCRYLRHVYLNVAWNIGEFDTSGNGIMFPSLQTLVIKTLTPKKMSGAPSDGIRSGNLNGYEFVMRMMDFFRPNAPLLRTLLFFEPTPSDVFVYAAFGEALGRDSSDEPWLDCRAG